MSHSLANSDRTAFAAYLEAWARTDFHERITGSDVPIKVIVGRHDPALGEQTMLATFSQWYPNLDIEVLPDAGHHAPDETRPCSRTRSRRT